MTDFSNPVIENHELPRYEDLVLKRVSKRYWRVMLLNFFISLLFVGALLTAILVIAAPPATLLFPIYAVFLAFYAGIYWLQKRAFQRRGYAVRYHDIIYRRGTLATLTTVIPFQRIQHISVNEGVFSRAYGLAQLQVFTAGGAGSDIRISGLLREDAVKIKELILNQMSKDEI